MIQTRFTKRYGLAHPVMVAPMAYVTGGALARAVTDAGGFGIMGGGYAELGWLAREYDVLGTTSMSCGFITWSLAHAPEALTAVLARDPKAVFLSFGDPKPFAAEIKAAGADLICQVQDMDSLKLALAAGADVIVAQGAEAGGHGATRGTMSLVAEVADHLKAHAPDVILLAAGGIADGRGLVAALALGADGVVMGTRFALAEDSLMPDSFIEEGLEATGDASFRSTLIDAARGRAWPAGYTCRTLKNAFSTEWAHKIDELTDTARAEYERAVIQENAKAAQVVLGEAVGLIQNRETAAEILKSVTEEATLILRAQSTYLEG
ncbi:MAG: NAD(P)H-dependent flavin oxidoreductase [Halocynthiibacter sp.]